VTTATLSRLERAKAELAAAQAETRAETCRERQRARHEERIRTQTFAALVDSADDWRRVCMATVGRDSKGKAIFCGEPVVAYLLTGGGEVIRCERGHSCGGHWRVVRP
jgi:hypothetical protein